MTKYLFAVNIEFLFCGEFYWLMMMIKIKIIILLLFNHFFISFYNDNDCVLMGYVVKYLCVGNDDDIYIYIYIYIIYIYATAGIGIQPTKV